MQSNRLCAKRKIAMIKWGKISQNHLNHDREYLMITKLSVTYNYSIIYIIDVIVGSCKYSWLTLTICFICPYNIHRYSLYYISAHGLRTPRDEIAFTARPKIQSQFFRYGQSIFCQPHRPNFSDSFDLCLHWVRHCEPDW